MALNAEQIMWRELDKILAPMVNEDFGAISASTAIKQLMQYIAEERADAADSRSWEEELIRHEDLLWQSRTTGTPDMFSGEMRWFWDNGAWGNV
jgi:hypothetical protein